MAENAMIILPIALLAISVPAGIYFYNEKQKRDAIVAEENAVIQREQEKLEAEAAKEAKKIAEEEAKIAEEAAKRASFLPAWSCVPQATGTPVSFNYDGDVQCWSNDGKNCVWDWASNCSTKLADAIIAGADKLVKPLACGEAHKNVYGNTGYQSPDHWCAKVKLNPTLSKGVRPTDIADCGYPNDKRGWFDFSGLGVRNDYCREVGEAPNVFASCYLAGAKEQMTPIGDKAKYDLSKPHDPYVVGQAKGNWSC